MGLLACPSSAIIANYSLTNDSFVDAASPGTNYGTALALELSSNWAHHRMFYVKQNISLPHNTIINSSFIYLYMYYDQTPEPSATIHGELVTSEWNETNITFSNQPSHSSDSTDSSSLSAIGWKVFNVSDFYKNWFNNTYPNYGAVFIRTGATTTANSNFFASRENTSHTPYISVEYYNSTEVPVITSPTNNSRTYQNSINITWSYPFYTPYLLYHYQIATDFAFTANLTQGNTSNLYSGNIATLDNQTHYMRVRGWDSLSSSNWSNIIQIFEIGNSSLTLVYPSNVSTIAPENVYLSWKEFPNNTHYTWQLATDPQYINVVASGAEATSNIDVFNTSSMTLSPFTTYYWHVKNSTGSYTSSFEFTTTGSATIPGQFNITVFDEQKWNSRVMTFSVQLYNSTSVLNKSTATGWVNFTGAEVSSGEYVVHILPNSSFASRRVIGTSPGNVTVYVPSALNTLDAISFYLLDYSGRFPYRTSYLSISKNNSVMHSSYFDSDAKVTATLIRGDSYKISLYNGNYMQEWGNYASVGSGNIEVTVMDLGVNTSIYAPFVSNITWSTSNITLKWYDANNVLTDLTFFIYKNNTTSSPVYSLSTTIKYGNVEYIVTDLNSTYYAFFTANTTLGQQKLYYIIDYRAGQKGVPGRPVPWMYNSYIMEAWFQSALCIVLITILGGSFGAMHRGEGSIITGIMAGLFWYWGWITMTTATASFMGAIILFAVLYHMESKRRQGGVY